MALGTLVFQLAPGPLLQMFNPTPALLEIGVPALRIISISFLFAGVAIINISLFQALGSGFLSLCDERGASAGVYLLPCAWLLATFVGRDAVWFSFVLSGMRVDCDGRDFLSAYLSLSKSAINENVAFD